jgi:D-3-phosphoglycerate dehydrogenase
MRILVADKLAPFVPGRLQDAGAEVIVDPTAKEARLTARIQELQPDVLIVRSTKVTAADLAASGALALVIRAGAGVNTIDLKAASARGVYVANCPGKNAVAVAELTIGHLVNLDRRIADNVAALRAHRWDKKSFGVARGLRGRTLAVLGTGQIGQEVIRRARAFEMRIVAWSRSLTDADAARLGVTRAPTPEDAVRDADAVSVHLALAPETRGRIGESVFAAMRPGAFFLNMARAEVVDQAALVRALESKGLRAGLDVFDGEPSAAQGDVTDPILDHPNVYGTHHIGASTDEAEEAVGEEVVRIVQAYGAGAPIPNCVNLATRTPATHLLVVRHADRVGVLANVLGVIREAGINIEDMQNIVFAGGASACARIGLVGALPADALGRLAADEAIFSISQVGVNA